MVRVKFDYGAQIPEITITIEGLPTKELDEFWKSLVIYAMGCDYREGDENMIDVVDSLDVVIRRKGNKLIIVIGD